MTASLLGIGVSQSASIQTLTETPTATSTAMESKIQLVETSTAVAIPDTTPQGEPMSDLPTKKSEIQQQDGEAMRELLAKVAKPERKTPPPMFGRVAAQERSNAPLAPFSKNLPLPTPTSVSSNVVVDPTTEINVVGAVVLASGTAIGGALLAQTFLGGTRKVKNDAVNSRSAAGVTDVTNSYPRMVKDEQTQSSAKAKSGSMLDALLSSGKNAISGLRGVDVDLDMATPESSGGINTPNGGFGGSTSSLDQTVESSKNLATKSGEKSRDADDTAKVLSFLGSAAAFLGKSAVSIVEFAAEKITSTPGETPSSRATKSIVFAEEETRPSNQADRGSLTTKEATKIQQKGSGQIEPGQTFGSSRLGSYAPTKSTVKTVSSRSSGGYLENLNSGIQKQDPASIVAKIVASVEPVRTASAPQGLSTRAAAEKNGPRKQSVKNSPSASSGVERQTIKSIVPIEEPTTLDAAKIARQAEGLQIEALKSRRSYAPTRPSVKYVQSTSPSSYLDSLVSDAGSMETSTPSTKKAVASPVDGSNQADELLSQAMSSLGSAAATTAVFLGKTAFSVLESMLAPSETSTSISRETQTKAVLPNNLDSRALSDATSKKLPGQTKDSNPIAAMPAASNVSSGGFSGVQVMDPELSRVVKTFRSYAPTKPSVKNASSTSSGSYLDRLAAVPAVATDSSTSSGGLNAGREYVGLVTDPLTYISAVPMSQQSNSLLSRDDALNMEPDKSSDMKIPRSYAPTKPSGKGLFSKSSNSYLDNLDHSDRMMNILAATKESAQTTETIQMPETGRTGGFTSANSYAEPSPGTLVEPMTSVSGPLRETSRARSYAPTKSSVKNRSSSSKGGYLDDL
jgi:hypothetical protein